MTTKRIVATIITIIVAFLILSLSFMIFLNVGAIANAPDDPTIEEPKKRTTSSSPSINGTTPVKSVRIKPIQNKNIKSGFSVQGRLRAYDKTDLVAEIPGLMKPLNKRFKIGSRYQKDEIIFEVDDAEARLNLKAQKAQLQTAITQMMPDLKIDMPASYTQWKNYLDRFDVNRSLSPFPKPLSDQEEYYVALKNLHSQYYNIKSAATRLGKYQVKAPFDGIITNVQVGESGYLRAGIPLGTIMNTSEYELEAAVPIADLKFVKKGGTVKVVSDDTGKSWTGRVVRIGDLIDAATQTATVYISLKGSGLREGQYLRAIINSNSINQASEIPRELILDRDQVFILKDSILSLIPIQMIKIEGDNAIVKGIPENAQLVLEKISISAEGQKVNIQQ